MTLRRLYNDFLCSVFRSDRHFCFIPWAVQVFCRRLFEQQDNFYDSRDYFYVIVCSCVCYSQLSVIGWWYNVVDCSNFLGASILGNITRIYNITEVYQIEPYKTMIVFEYGDELRYIYKNDNYNSYKNSTQIDISISDMLNSNVVNKEEK